MIREHRRGGFTLVELLVVVAIIAIMATMVMGALNIARETAREARTKATIMKIHDIIMQKYDAFLTRRVPVDTTGMPPKLAAQTRLAAIRYLMMMEMPERFNDINRTARSATVSLPNNKTMPWSSLAVLYGDKFAAQQPATDGSGGAKNGNAKCLYMVVTMGSPEAREMFNDSEIVDVDGDGYPVFIDAWGNPISFLRWAPGFKDAAGVSLSDIQTFDPVNDHDPFDPMNTDPGAYKLTPLIYSAGRDKHYCIEQNKTFTFSGNNLYTSTAGAPATDTDPVTGAQYSNYYYDNIHNHHIEAR